MAGTVTRDADALVDDAVALAERWLAEAVDRRTARERRTAARLAGVVGDERGLAVTTRLVDRVARHRADRLAARQLDALVHDLELPEFFGRADRGLLRAGALVGRAVPALVMPLARRRLRALAGHLVVDAERRSLHRHLADRRRAGFDQNVNLLGEMVLGDDDAERRVAATLALIDDPAVDHVSVKVSGIASQLDLWSYEHTLDRVVDRLRLVMTAAARSDPPTFVNLDMEEYRDLQLTIDAFIRVLDDPELHQLDAGIVLQAYLPDSVAALDRLTDWATARRERAGAGIRIRLVKGANLAMERVDAALHGWPQAPYPTKAEVDANYARCIDRALTPERTRAVRIGVGSHNLFVVAWAHLVAEARGVSDRVGFEMLQGIAPAAARAVRERTGSMLLYTPIVGRRDFDVAISYLFRRLEENAAPENFLYHLLVLDPAGGEFAALADQFRRSIAQRDRVDDAPRRREPGRRPADGRFANEPDSDPALPATRAWVEECRRRPPAPVAAPITELATGGFAAIDRVVERGRAAQRRWHGLGAAHRREVLHRVADELTRRRPELVAAMVHEARKLPSEADPEVSEAIDFTRWYADRAAELEHLEHAAFEPLGVVAVVPPWNFPVAIPTGGTTAALAAGNSVVLKPAPQTPRCAEIVAEACWSAGVGRDVIQFVRTPDDEIGHRLVTRVDGVVFTGSWETATMFRRWRPDLPLFAETSGKNALVVTPEADHDLAVSDLVHSAFGHSGQKCSAASLAILVDDLADDRRFLDKLIDATRTLRVGWSTEQGATLGPLIEPARGPLLDALRRLGPGERWLLEPRQLGGPRHGRSGHNASSDGALWSPGIKTGVTAGSAFHLTECFGPVLGLMRARDLDEAIELQNSTPYGLTGGIHSLDDHEIEHWLERVEVGNAYVNRHITGAIVRRQPFGGWKRSVLGPGAKTGGFDQLLQLGTAVPTGATADGDADRFLELAAESDRRWMDEHYGREHDPTGLFCEANVLRYRTRPATWIRAAGDAPPAAVRRAAAAAARCGAVVGVSIDADHPGVEPLVAQLAAHPGGVSVDDDARFCDRLAGSRFGRVRLVTGGSLAGDALRSACHTAEVDLIDAPVTANGRIELRWYLREQSVSRTLHRFGNVTGVHPPDST